MCWVEATLHRRLAVDVDDLHAALIIPAGFAAPLKGEGYLIIITVPSAIPMFAVTPKLSISAPPLV